MANLVAIAAAALATGLFGLALLGMAAGELRLAGFSFLAASLTIYVRESRLVGD